MVKRGLFWRYTLAFLLLFTGVPGQAVGATDSNVLRLTQFNVLRSNVGSDLSKGLWQPISLPDAWREHARTPFRNAWYQTTLNAADVVFPFAIYIPRVSMNVAVFVNGHEIGNGGRFSEPISRNHGYPLIFHTPPWMKQEGGEINLTIRVADNAWALGYLGPVYVGDPASLTIMHRARYFWQVQLAHALALMMLIFSVASFALYARRRKDKFYFWFAAAMLLFAIDTFNVFVVDIPIDRRSWDIYGQMVIFAFAIATIIFIQRFTRLGWKRAEGVLGLLWILKLIVLSLIDVSQLYFVASVFNLIVISYGVLLAAIVIASYIKTAGYETGVTALSGLLLLAVAFHTWLIQVGVLDPENLHIIHFGAPGFFLLISFSLIRRFLISLECAEALANQLDARVREKEKELATTYEKLSIANQKRTLLEERARIMREVHDGFGGHVIGALAMLEDEKPNQARLSDYLKSSLLDLRVMIDSLDPNTREVCIALATLRSRVTPILKSRNISLIWDMHSLPLDLALNPSETLSVLRILQELITNVVKHSEADQINISACSLQGKNTTTLQIKFWENGQGFDPNARTGRGLVNVRKRIDEMSGELKYKQDINGIAVWIRLPVCVSEPIALTELTVAQVNYSSIA